MTSVQDPSVERAAETVALMQPSQKVLSADDWAMLLTYLQCGEYLFNGKDTDRFVEIKRKVAIAVTGAVQYEARERVPVLVGHGECDATNDPPKGEIVAHSEPDASQEG